MSFSVRTPFAAAAFAVSLSATLLAVPGCTGEPEPGEPDDTAAVEPEGPPPCEYPESTALTGVGSVIANTTWEGAFNGDGSQFDFSLEEFHCSEDYAQYDTILFIIVTEWCPNCPGYLDLVAGQLTELQNAGTLVVVADVQDRSYAMPTSDMAHAYVSGYQGSLDVVRVGDASAVPQGTIALSSIFQSVPNAFFVRKSDMQVIATQESSPYYLPLVDIASDPTADWSNPGPPAFAANCTEEDEEDSEPNDEPLAAAPLAPGVLEGGICNARPDYFTIDIEGDWELLLEFTHAEGDLDVYVVDNQGQPLTEAGGAPIGSDSISDNESFSHAGPARIMVYGYQAASTTYTLTLTEL